MRKAAVIDLDQTFVTVNTFKKYIAYIGRTAASRGRIDICAGLCAYVGMRKLRLITHEKMKREILRVSASFFSGREQDFAEKLARYVDPAVIKLINSLKEKGYYVCMSTAAPASYAAPLASMYGFDGYVATPVDVEGDWHENSRENKCAATLSYLTANDAVIDVFATDHYDDLPLLRVKKTYNYLVNPSESTVKRLNDEGISFVKI